MTHQTLISSSNSLVPFNPSTTTATTTSSSPSSRLPLPLPLPRCTLQSPPHFDSSQDRRMEEALKSSLRREPLALSGQQHHQGLLVDDLASAALERGSFLGDGFSVDDLLDLGGFAEPEKETEEKPEKAVESIEAEENSNFWSSSSSSALSFEPPLSSEISFPMSPLPLMAQDVEELEWVSLIIDDSLSEFPPSCSSVAPPFPPPPPPKPQAESPPENRPASSRGPTICALATEALVPVKAKRSKRPRSAAAGWSLSGPPPFADSSTTTTTSSSSSCSSSSSSFESYLIYEPTATAGGGEYNLLLGDIPPPPAPPSKKHKPKKRGRKPKPPQAASAAAAAGGGERRCSHCGVQKTPQWRAGPLGAKTLCNACGVRYKSGRLLPEYRPACSPTFISDVHSNSHRKVLEMRRKKEADLLAATAPPVPSF